MKHLSASIARYPGEYRHGVSLAIQEAKKTYLMQKNENLGIILCRNVAFRISAVTVMKLQ